MECDKSAVTKQHDAALLWGYNLHMERVQNEYLNNNIFAKKKDKYGMW